MSKSRQVPLEPTELAERLHAAAIRLVRHVRRQDSAMGLPPAQASALSVLVFGGAQTLSGLAAVEQVRAPTMTRIVDALERAGLVQREPHADDRRKLRIAATRAGTRLMQQGRARRVAALTQLLAVLKPSERSTLNVAVDLLGELHTRQSGQ